MIILNWIFFILFSVQAGRSVYLLTTYVKCWWCLTNKRNRRKYSLFAVVSLLVIVILDLLSFAYFGIRYSFVQYSTLNFNFVLVLSYSLFFILYLFNDWLLYIIKYYRNHILYKEGNLPKWTG